MKITDPKKRYALIRFQTNVVERVFTGEELKYDEQWTRYIEIAEDSEVAPGHIWRGEGDSFYDLSKPPLEHTRAEALYAIDKAAGETRARYITIAPGQEASYLIKERQAEAFKAASYRVDAIPPMIQAEMDAANLSAQAAAEFILAQRDAWVTMAAAVESARRKGKVGVGMALTLKDIYEARDTALRRLAGL